MSPDLGPNCLQRLSADDKRINYIVKGSNLKENYVFSVAQFLLQWHLTPLFRYIAKGSYFKTNTNFSYSMVTSLQFFFINKRCFLDLKETAFGSKIYIIS